MPTSSQTTFTAFIKDLLGNSSQYMTIRTSNFAVAHAIHRGLITEEEAGADAIEMLRVHLAFLRDQEDEDSAQLPDTRLQDR